MYVIGKEKHSRFLAWLEKKKEQKPWKVGANAYFTPEQKPVEWSEEDEKMLTDISWAIRHCAYDDKKKERVMKWFNDDYRKSLRPSWKPSKEQMRALYCALNDAISLYSDKVSPLYEEISRTHFDALESLYNDLKKLM